MVDQASIKSFMRESTKKTIRVNLITKVEGEIMRLALMYKSGNQKEYLSK